MIAEWHRWCFGTKFLILSVGVAMFIAVITHDRGQNVRLPHFVVGVK